MMTGVDFIYQQEEKIIMIMITTIQTSASFIILSSYLYQTNKTLLLYLNFLSDGLRIT